MKKYDVIAEIKTAKLLKALYLPNIFSLSFWLQKLYKNAISHPEDPDIPRAVSIVWHKKPKNSLQNNKLALPKKNNK